MSSLSIGQAAPVPHRPTSAPPASGWARSTSPDKRRGRFVFAGAALGAVLALGSYTAMRTVPWFGPLVADTLRSTVGRERVTELEEAVANVEDHVERVTSDGKARSLADATPEALLGKTDPSSLVPERTAARAPSDVTPLFPGVAATDDGTFRPIPTRAGNDHAIYRTMLHPDAERSYAELFVFALDLSKFELHAVAGSIEPKSDHGSGGVERPGVVPADELPHLVAAFNGGFKAEHGEFGMMVDGNQLLAPKSYSCTVAANPQGDITIGTWNKLTNTASYAWWRQTPGCMLENGALHPGLRSDDTKNWGATIDGKTVIRRSALGLSSDRHTLFVGISNSTTARAMALGMQRAGADTVAQLDVNFSYPRFLVYEPDPQTGDLTAVGAVKGLVYGSDEYVGRASSRDFFYVTAR